jgi:hypothetical protein
MLDLLGLKVIRLFLELFNRQEAATAALKMIRKKLQPVFQIFKIDVNNEKHLLDSLMSKLGDYMSATNRQLMDYELKMKANDKTIEQITATYDEQLQKTLRLLREKETLFQKQKESLVAYYEQLLVNHAGPGAKVS